MASLLRSVLYMPGANQRAMDKARSLPCDCVIFDLEDAVAPDMKPAARSQVLAQVEATSIFSSLPFFLTSEKNLSLFSNTLFEF